MPVRRVAAGASNDRPQDVSGSPACLDVLQLLPSDVMRPRTGLPRNFGDAVTANVQQCGAPPCKPVRSTFAYAYRSVSAAYTRYPACPYEARLVRLSKDACVGFDAGAFPAPHASEDAG